MSIGQGLTGAIKRKLYTVNADYGMGKKVVPETQGNIDLNSRPQVINPDKSISTVRSITVTDDNGKAILLPTVVGNKVVSNDEAIDHYKKTGEHLGVFSNETLANAYAIFLHHQQDKEYTR